MKKVRYILFLFLSFIFIMGIIFLPNMKKNYKSSISNRYSTAQIEGFEKSIFGSTGWAAINLPLKNSADGSSNTITTVSAGQPFMVLGDKGNYWEIQYGDYHGYIDYNYCMINLPDVVPSINYNITNAYSSVYRTRDNNGYIDIPGATGQVLYGKNCSNGICEKINGTGKAYNSKIERDEFIVPSLYSAAKKIAKAQSLAKADGYSLLIYDSYRPFSASEYVATKFNTLFESNTQVQEHVLHSYGANTGTRYDWTKTYFIAQVSRGSHISAHNVGSAIDVTLCKYENGTCNEVNMFTPMHQLSTDSIKYYSKDVAKIPDNYSGSMLNDENAKRLDNYMINENVGMGTLASEWWHFEDTAGRDRLTSATNKEGCDFQATSIVSNYGYTGDFTTVGDVNGDGVVNSDDAELIYKLYKFLQNNTCDTCGTLIQYSDMNGDWNINLDDIYLILNKDNDLITSSYSLGDGYIDVGNGTFDSSNITLKNVPNVSSYVSDNKYLITYHDEEIKSYDIVSYSNDDHDLSKSYLLYKGGLDQAAAERTSGKFNCTNCVVEYDFDNNKVYIKKNSESSNSLREYDIVYPIYEGHDLSKAYIYTGNDPLEVANAMRDSRFTSVNSSLIYYNNKVYIVKKLNSTENVDMENMPSDDIYATYDVVFYFSDDYVLGDSVDLNSNKVDDLLDKIHCHKCDISVYNGDNRITSGNIPSGSKIIINENVTTNKKKLEDSTVNYRVSDITLTESSRINVGEEDELYYMIIPDYSTNQNVTWESSDPSIVTVDSTGKITGVGVGEATVTVTTEDGNHSASCSVTVTDKYIVTYHWSGIATRYYSYGDEVDLDYNNIICHDFPGYEFIGWKYNNVIYNSSNKLYMPREYIDLYAEWKLISDDINNYTIENHENEKIIKGIHLNTSVSNFSLGLDQKYTVKVYETDNSTIKTSGIIGTGNIIKVYNGDNLVDEYTVSIKDDLNGDGIFNFNDAVLAYRYYFTSYNSIDECVKIAADHDENGISDFNDFVLLYRQYFNT